MQRQSIKDLDRKRCDQDERENEMNKKNNTGRRWKER